MSNIQVSDVNLNVEFIYSKIQVSGLMLQVEVDVPITLSRLKQYDTDIKKWKAHSLKKRGKLATETSPSWIPYLTKLYEDEEWND
jgi:hypothetical protein